MNSCPGSPWAEATAYSSADDIGGDGDGQMGLAGAGAADQDDIAPCGQERAAVQRTDQPLVDRGPLEVEGIDVLPYLDQGRPSKGLSLRLVALARLRLFLDDGRDAIDNNAAERTIRPISLMS